MAATSTPNRRRILKGGAALGALGLAGIAPAVGAPKSQPKSPLPIRGNVIIRNAYVMTMVPGSSMASM